MKPLNIRICPELPEHEHAIEQLNCQAFGPGRFARSAYRLREGVPAERGLGFVALLDGPGAAGPLAGAVRQTGITIGSRGALLLGPLVVAPENKNLGIGRELMNRTIRAASLAGHEAILLVGDYSYYSRFGFWQVPPGTITLPGPVDPRRVLFRLLEAGAGMSFSGPARILAQKNNTP